MEILTSNRDKSDDVLKNLLDVIFSCLFEVVVKRTSKFIEKTDLFAILQKAGRCRGLVCKVRAIFSSLVKAKNTLRFKSTHQQ